MIATVHVVLDTWSSTHDLAWPMPVTNGQSISTRCSYASGRSAAAYFRVTVPFPVRTGVISPRLNQTIPELTDELAAKAVDEVLPVASALGLEVQPDNDDFFGRLAVKSSRSFKTS